MDLARAVETAAAMRKESIVARRYIDEAILKIESGEVEVERYPMGAPSLVAVYNLAKEIELAAQN